ncbi:hypothetical protein Rhopal_004354-T1 [Rhodotorula paludigena]|uniref:Major facilitator superfamily (MFS) profile domain-containing protein n=1 Tax=Rhodotorula paludigena TaxID=86838 RepID=A0AAV5GM96_9BASI|nr:hypothetical protein Rhopal_004354-T1 [Rhodotorula paludigena]
MSLVNDKARPDAEKREFSDHSPPPTTGAGRIAKKDAFAGAEIPEGIKMDASGIPTYMGANGKRLDHLVTVAASCGFILFGYDQGVMSGLISSPQFVRTFTLADASIQGSYQASVYQAFYVAIYTVGCLGGAIFALLFGDRLGRRKMIAAGSYVMTAGIALQVTSFRGHWASGQYIIGRLVAGFGTGFHTSTIPTWHAECAKAHSRGLAVFIEAAMISTGTMLSYWIDLGFSFMESDASWRVPVAIQCVFAVILNIMIVWLPESPRWLVSKGHMVEAQRVIAALEPAPMNSETVILQTKVIADALEGQTRQRKRDLLTNGPTQHLRRVLIGSSSQFFQQIGGCNAVIYFSTVIFEDYLGVDRTMALILGSVLATVYALAACISFPLVDRIGRRKLFYIGTVGQALSMFLIMACIIPGQDSSAINGSIVGLFLFLTFFGFTWLELPWLYPAEVNPLKTRTNANAVSTINNWLWNAIGAINLMFLPVIRFFYLETSGRSLEEIDIIFARGYVEGVSYVKMAKEMPRLSGQEIEAEWQRLGLSDEARPASVAGSTTGAV